MRLYAKLILMVALFAGLVSPTARRMTGNLAYEARVAFVYAFGSEADRQRLIEYTGRLRAAQRDCLDAYLANECFRQSIGFSGDGYDDTATLPEENSTEEIAGSGHSVTASLETTLDGRPVLASAGRNAR